MTVIDATEHEVRMRKSCASVAQESGAFGGYYGLMVHLMRQINPEARQSIIDCLQTNLTIFGDHAMYTDMYGDPR